ncbi:hypothetical protein [Collimonas humicola]|uniref:hypothetical protein n=1 Tax=Collimonas humicola TaxID=2825886 RepID=UPI001B8D08F9|nr:hypothetical protein [Collimonas humicola]
MQTWQTILLAFGGNAALLAVLAYIGKALLEKILARDTTRFVSDLKAKSDAAVEHLKSDLKAKSDTAVEHLKSDLQLRTIEHQVRFSRLHEKRASVITDLYGHLVETLWEAESFLSPMQWVGEPSKKEKHGTTLNQLAIFYRYFDKHRIYLPETLCTSLESLLLKVRSHVIHFGVYVQLDEAGLPDHARQQKDEAWNKGWEAINTEIPPARKRLEDEFRSLLGGLSNPLLKLGDTTNRLDPSP